ncbi:pyochelin biosynthetic protein PchC [Sinosporangium album]|uniref:Pyochelin biosynthetic protein PchC n=1 Tax=Sinosporangium album TaxID=504805 RepID=A0A1G8GNB7_9ACTN|nr:alpha/beta fold hydrolase [Sinosporangium album]SDH95872.1 pyochelin biosynthetic protein PchC [Sinosporangium album]
MTKSTQLTNPWIRLHLRRSEVRARLICLPHAGGGASFYRGWAASLPDWLDVVAVQYPGREDRTAEPLIDDLDTLADGVACAVAPLFDVPTALFGHSMGAVLAYHVAARLVESGTAKPAALHVSACPSPDRPRDTAYHTLDDDGLAAVLRRHGGTDPVVLADPELREIVLGVVRNDYRMLETYEPKPPVALPVPIVAYCPDADETVNAEAMADWALATSRDFTLRRLRGGHFYLADERTRVWAEIVGGLADAC